MDLIKILINIFIQIWNYIFGVEISYKNQIIDLKGNLIQVTLFFEVTNVTKTVMSLRDYVEISLFGGEMGSNKKKLNILNGSIKLEPFSPQVITVSGDVDLYSFTLFGKMKFSFHKGRSVKLYFFRQPKNRVSFLHFYVSYILYSVFGIVPKLKSNQSEND